MAKTKEGKQKGKVMGDWISVEDELPETGVVVLAFGSHYEPVTAYKTAISWYVYSDDDSVVGVTHWQPLPDRPKT
jgi:hypothetical protein